MKAALKNLKQMGENDFKTEGEGLIQATYNKMSPDKFEGFFNDLYKEHNKKDDYKPEDNKNNIDNMSFQNNNDCNEKVNIDSDIKTNLNEMVDEIIKQIQIQ